MRLASAQMYDATRKYESSESGQKSGCEKLRPRGPLGSVVGKPDIGSFPTPWRLGPSDRQPGSYQLAGRVSIDKRASVARTDQK